MLHLRDPESELEAAFIPGAGMLCCSLIHRGEELLAQNAGIQAYAERGKTMGIPLLYPWANRLADFRYSAAGKQVVLPRDPQRIATDDHGLPIHGVIAGNMAWTVTHPPDADARRLTARLSWSDAQAQLSEVFPFHHDIDYEARLEDGCLRIEIAVHASGEDQVPLAFGFHPYVSLPDSSRQRWSVQLPPMRHLALDGDQLPREDGHEQMPARAFELDGEQFDDGFDAVSQPARFSVSDDRRRVELEFLEGYPCAQVYAPLQGKFICFEPMTAQTNALSSGRGLRVLAPGETARARFVVRIEQRAADE